MKRSILRTPGNGPLTILTLLKVAQAPPPPPHRLPSLTPLTFAFKLRLCSKVAF